MSDSNQRPRRPPMRRGYNEMGPQQTRRPPMRSGGRTEPQTGQSSQPPPAQQPQQQAPGPSGGVPQFPLVTPGTVPFYPPPSQGGQVFLRQVPLQFPQPVSGQPLQAQLNPAAPSGSTQSTTAPSIGDQPSQGGASGPPRRPPIVTGQPRPQYNQPIPVVSQEQFQQMQNSGQITMIPQQVIVSAQPLAQVPIVPMTGPPTAPATAASAVASGGIPATQPATSAPEASMTGPPATEPPSNAAPVPAVTESPKRRGQPWGNKEKPRVFGWATVRQVLSGQSLQLEIRKSYKRDADFKIDNRIVTLLLDCVSCPTIGRRKKREDNPQQFEFDADEPYAFEAKEFTRKTLLQATRCNTDPVIFAAWNVSAVTKTSKTPRYYGDVYIVNKDGGAPASLSLLLIKSGFGRLKVLKNPSIIPGNLHHDEFERLKAASEEAKTKEVGQFQSGNAEKHKRRMIYTTNFREVLHKYDREQFIDGIVDYVVDACTLRVEICPTGDIDTPRESNLLVRLAGVRSIDTQRDEHLSQYANEAKAFVEKALLDQDVKIRFVTADDRNLYAQVLHPTGRRIAVALLYQGYAEMVQWVAKEIRDPTEITEMKSAQQRARDGRVKLWSHKTVPDEDDEGEYVTVTRVLSGDKLEVRYHNGNNAREIVRLSSIRAPARQPAGPDRNGEWKNEAFFRQAKEFLRAKTIGKQVLMFKDYEREQKQGDSMVGNRQVYATILVGNGENVAESLLRKGLAKIIQRGSKDDPSRDYIKLYEAFDQAKKSHAYKLENKEEPGSTPMDFSALDRPQSAGRGSGGKKQQKQTKRRGGGGGGGGGGRPKNSNERRRINVFTSLKNSDRRVKCVVEMIFSATKFKLYVEQHNAFITFQISHIRCDRAPPLKERSMNYVPGRATKDPGLDAIRLVTDQLMQREVYIEVLETENNTNLKGNLYYGSNRNIAEELLERGLANVFTWIPRNQRSGQRQVQAPARYLEIQEVARSAKLGGWSKEQDENDDNEDSERKVPLTFGEEIPIVIAHIASATEFWANREEHSQLMDEVAAALDGYEKVAFKRPRAGKLCVGKYNGVWARCEVIKKNVKRSDSNFITWFVTFVDYGNRASLTEDNLGKCPKELNDLTRYPHLAFKCQLAGLQSPDMKDFSNEFNMSGEFFASKALPQSEGQSKILRFKVLYDTAAMSRFHRSQKQQQKTKWGELFDRDTSINKVLVSEGYAMLDSDENLRVLTELENEETTQYVQAIRRLKDEALSRHLNIWHTGDVYTLDDDQ